MQDDDEAVQRSPYQPAAVVQLLPARKVPPNEIGEESDWENPLLRDNLRGLVDPTNKMVLVNQADDTRYYSFVYKDFFFRQLRAGLNAEYEEVSGNGVYHLQHEQSPNVVEVDIRNLRTSLKWDGKTYHTSRESMTPGIRRLRSSM